MSEFSGFRCDNCRKMVELNAMDGIPKDVVRIRPGSLIMGIYYFALDFCSEACFMAWLGATGGFDFISKDFVEKSFAPTDTGGTG